MSSSTALASEPGGPCARGGAVPAWGDALTPEFVLLVLVPFGSRGGSLSQAGLIALLSSSIWKVEARVAACSALGTDLH